MTDNIVVVSATSGPWAAMLTAQHAAYAAHKLACPSLWVDWSQTHTSGAVCQTCNTVILTRKDYDND